MHAAHVHKLAKNEPIEIVKNAELPAISKGQVLVEIYAAGVNPFDWKMRKGLVGQFDLKFPITLGGDFSGIVKEIGEGVGEFKVGDDVFGQTHVLRGGSGSFAEFASVGTETIARKPKMTDHIEAAALPLTGVSAWQALHEHLKLKKGDKILIHGGAGGIGSIAIQIAKYLGAYVATTVAGRDAHFIKRLGADEVINYQSTTQSFDTLLQGYDAVFDTVGGETYKKSFKILKHGGTIVSMLEKPNEELMKEYGVTAIAQFTQITTERLNEIARYRDHEIIKAHVDKTFPLDQTAEALDYLESGQATGKVVIQVKT